MQCQSRLKRPLWRIIKSIGTSKAHNDYATTAQRFDTVPTQNWRPTFAKYQTQSDDNGAAAESSQAAIEATERDLTKAKRFDQVTRFAFRRDSRKTTAKVQWQQKRRPQLEQGWRDILQLLESSTPTGPAAYLRQYHRALIPQGHRGYCKIPGGEFILEINLQTGCVIVEHPSYFVRQENSNAESVSIDGFQHVTLSGTPQEIAQALALLPNYLFMVDERMPNRPLNLHLTTEKASSRDLTNTERPPVIRSTLETVQQRPKPVAEVIAQRPLTWSTIAFANYVRDLTMKRPRLMMRRGAGDVSHTHSMIANELKSLYIGVVNLTEFMSSEAVDLTLTWFLRWPDRFPTLQQIVAFLETRSSHQMTVSNYETLLRHAALNLDVHNFLYVLRTMLARDLRPTWRSFSHLYDMVSKLSPNQAAVVLDCMRRKGVLANPDALRQIAPRCVISNPEDLFNANLDDMMATVDLTLDSTILGAAERPAEMPCAQPRRWLTFRSANMLSSRLLRRNRLDDAWKVLTELEGSGGKIDHRTVRVLLRHAKTLNSPMLAIDTLRYMETTHNIGAERLDSKTWHLLWRLAWRSRCFNLSRVIWRYSCLYGHVDGNLQQAMEASIFRTVPSPRIHKQLADMRPNRGMPDGKPFSIVSLFFGWVAKFCVGISAGLRRERPADRDATSKLTRHDLDVLTLSSDASVLQDSELQDRYRLCGRLLRADQVPDLYLPRTSFAEMLDEAWQKDQVWLDPQHRPYGEALELQWADLKDLDPEERRMKISYVLQRCFERMLQDAVQVPVRHNTMGYREGLEKLHEIRSES